MLDNPYDLPIPTIYNKEFFSYEFEGQRWAHASELCQAFRIRNPGRAISRIENKIDSGVFETPYWIIDETSVFELLLRDRSPGTEGFRRWFNDTVVPAIRQNRSGAAPRCH